MEIRDLNRTVSILAENFQKESEMRRKDSGVSEIISHPDQIIGSGFNAVKGVGNSAGKFKGLLCSGSSTPNRSKKDKR